MADWAWYDIIWDGKKIGDPRVAEHWFMNTLIHPLWMLLIYFVMVYYAMPRYMRARDNVPLDDMYIYIRVYNAASAVMNIVLGAAIIDIMRRADYSVLCQPVRTGLEIELKMVSCMYIFFLYKIIELFETLIFIGNNDTRRVHTQHVYHHASILLLSWFGVKFLPGGSTAFPALLSCITHVLLVVAYRVNAVYNVIEKQNLGTAQLVCIVAQHGLILLQCGSILWIGCGYPSWAALVLICYCFSFGGMLVIKLFIRQYIT